jgi:hypothetical protein
MQVTGVLRSMPPTRRQSLGIGFAYTANPVRVMTAHIFYSAQCHAHICAVHSALLLVSEFVDIIFSFVWFNRFGGWQISYDTFFSTVQLLQIQTIYDVRSPSRRVTPTAGLASGLSRPTFVLTFTFALGKSSASLRCESEAYAYLWRELPVTASDWIKKRASEYSNALS